MTKAYKYNLVLEKVSKPIVCENEEMFRNIVTGTPDEAVDYIRNRLGFGRTPTEEMGILALNIKNIPIGFYITSKGGLSYSFAHPREVFAFAITANAHTIILVHNHPSGDCTESASDIKTTKQLVEAGKVIGIEIADHIILGDDCYTSLRQKGYIA